MLKSWKTTTAGILTAICYLGYKLLTHQPLTGEDFTLAAGMVGLGMLSKDSDVTGGTKGATTEASKRIGE